MKKIIHVSDTHGTFPELPEGDFVIHSGDMLPNKTRGNWEIEPRYQTEWVENRIEIFRDWLGGRPFLFCQGNHDFIEPCQILKRHGINAIDLTNKVVVHQGIVFYGLPFIPFIIGEWNHEKHLPEMNNEMRYMLERIKDAQVNLDILVAHAPPMGVLDLFDDNHWGNSLLSNMLTYNQIQPLPKYILCGHVHNAHGSTNIFGVEISQAATRVHVIEYNQE